MARPKRSNYSKLVEEHNKALKDLGLDPDRSLTQVFDKKFIEHYNFLAQKLKADGRYEPTPYEKVLLTVVSSADKRAKFIDSSMILFKGILLKYYANGYFSGDYRLDGGLCTETGINPLLKTEIEKRILRSKRGRKNEHLGPVDVIDVCGGIGKCISSIKKRYDEEVMTYLYDLLDVSQHDIVIWYKNSIKNDYKKKFLACPAVQKITKNIDHVYAGLVEYIKPRTREKRFDIVISTTSLGAYTFSGVEDLKNMHDILKVGGTALVEISIRPDDVFFAAYKPRFRKVDSYINSFRSQCSIEILSSMLGQYFLRIDRTTDKNLELKR